MTKSKNMLNLITLMSRHTMTINAISTRFGISTRTVKRYLADIRESGVTLITYYNGVTKARDYSVSID